LAVAFCLPVVGFAAPQSAPAQTAKAAVNEAGDQLRLQGRLLLDARRDGFMSLKEVRYSPAGDRFLVIACGYECNDNVGFVFKAGGDGKRKITSRWDYILQSAIEWSKDGGKIYYFRINSTGADPPPGAPAEGWVEVDLKTGRKSPATTRTLKTDASYAVFNVARQEVLNLRARPNPAAESAGALPPDARGIKVTGAGVRIGRARWVPIEYEKITGWVNQNYLYEEAATR
jgi:hypothetical protein